MPGFGLVGPLLIELGLDRVEQFPIEDRGLLAWEGLPLNLTSPM